MSMEISRKLPKYSQKEEMRTVQADAEEADINKIVARMLKGNFIPEFKGEPFYGDVSMFTNLADMKKIVSDAEELFMTFPADLRERFSNNPVELVDFLGDVKNRPEAEKLGLIQKAPESPVVAPPASGGTPPAPPVK